jgi:transposase
LAAIRIQKLRWPHASGLGSAQPLKLSNVVALPLTLLTLQWLTQLEGLEKQSANADLEIERQNQPYQVTERLMTIPSVDRITACDLVAEISCQHGVIPSARHLASRAVCAPAMDDVASKRQSGTTQRGTAKSPLIALARNDPGDRLPTSSREAKCIENSPEAALIGAIVRG